MNRSRRVAPALFALLLAACGIQAPSTSPSSTDAPAASGVDASLPAAPSFVADVDRLREHLEALQAIADDHDGIRFAGTAGYEASVDYAADALRDLGFEVSTPEVSFTGFRELPGGRLEVGERAFLAPDELHALIYSPGGDVTGRVRLLDESGCEPEHFSAVEDGEIALTVQGGCFRRQQALNAAQAGAAALLVGYPDRGPGEIFRPTLIDPEGIELPVVSVTGEAVEALEAMGDEPVRLVIETERAPATLRNVVAQLGDGEDVVMLGAHLDSVLDGPGLNDNGSGVAAMLEIARGLSEGGVPDGSAVRIGLWGAEELGTIGSRAYVESLEDDPAAYLNIDMAGSLDGATLVYDEPSAPEGSAAITSSYEAWLTERGEEFESVDLGGSSDHFGFAAAGIPTGGLFAGASETGSAAQPGAGGGGPAPDACYHLACDDIGNVDLDRVALFAEATFAVTYAIIATR